MSGPAVELFIIGNEILIGEIQDTNTNWLCKEINNFGGVVSRVTILRDVHEVIAEEIAAALTRGAGIIITSGGLGPTADDLTLAAVAAGAGVPLELDRTALQMVKDRYDEFQAQGILAQGGLNPAREKMAWLPAGALPLHNPVGTAPGVLLELDRCAIISLPGVPPELRGIFNTSLNPFMQKAFSRGVSVLHTIAVRCNDESLMEPVLSRVTKAHPRVYIKSLATAPGEFQELDITLTTVGKDEAELKTLLEGALDDLREGLSTLGIPHRNKTGV
ncbi:competence/damage-inducible protein A [Geomonas sp. RF6]|uniref:competence/damage-inducible protein A n=1 Tax=Geomonas sp. RF6 TaxID=2897342 RepID=UPI001E44DB72|nr:molybdopterin-binding protein [Geomonas sp. RF6]UFS71213.1 competence/damage-inducible protein A [Geomonas sp. RF6]